MHPLPVTIPAAVLPALLLVAWFWRTDKFPEPLSVVGATFVLGVLSIVPALAMGIPVGLLLQNVSNPRLYGTLQAFFCAAVPEESAKFLVLWFFCLRRPALNEPMDGIVYGAAASLGFAAFENTLYVHGYGLGVAVVRALTSVPAHAVFGMFIGYHLAVWKLSPAPGRFAWAKGLLIAIGLHGVYDMPLLINERILAFEAVGVFEHARISVGWFLLAFAGILLLAKRTILGAKQVQSRMLAETDRP